MQSSSCPFSACVFHSRLGYESESEGVRFIRVREDLPVGGEVLTLRAYPRNSIILKSMDRSADHHYFRLREVNATNIQVLLEKSLEDLVDRDTPQNLIKFKIQCSSLSGRNDEQTSYMTITVYIEDINDHYPIFQNMPYAVAVDEATPVGSTIFHSISAFDRDKPNTPNSDVQFSIGPQEFDSAGPYFALESPHRPSVVLKRSLDYDDGIRMFDVVILASDRGTPTRTSNATLKVMVRDHDDLPPKFTEGVYRTRVNEFSPLTGKAIRVPLYFNPPIKAFDQDSINSSLIYDIIAGNERRLFRVNPANGMLYLEKEIDLEEESLPGNTFVLQLEARQRDSPQKRAVARVEVELVDVNDNAPEFEVDLYNISIVENLPSGFSVLQVNAIDRDQGENAEFFYKFSNEKPEGAFLIDARTGWITVRDQALLDREARSSITMKVHAIEKKLPFEPRDSTGGSVQVEITLLDSNDNTPQFQMGNLYEFKIGLDSPVGYLVGHVTAKDPDEGRNGLILYDLQRPRGSGVIPFQIDPQTGALTVSGQLRRGRIAIFVEASDQPANPSERRFSLAVVTIEILRGSFDGSIDFIGAPYEFWVGADVPVGTSVGQIKTTIDWDAQGEQVMYDLLHSYSEGVPFAVEERSGTVTVIRDLEDFSRNIYEFEAVATHVMTSSGEVIEIDEGVISESKNVLVTNVTIHVVSPDDEKGILMRGTSADPIEFRVAENLAGALIGQLVYNNNATMKLKHSDSRVKVTPVALTSGPPPTRRKDRRLNSTKFVKNATSFNTIPKSRRRHRDTESQTNFFVAVAPSVFFDEDYLTQESASVLDYVRAPKSRDFDNYDATAFDSRRNSKFPNYFDNFESTKVRNESSLRPKDIRKRTPAPRESRKFDHLPTTTEIPPSTYRPRFRNSGTYDGKTVSSTIETYQQIRQNNDTNRGLHFLIANQRDVTDMITITNDGTLMTLKGLDREERDTYRLTVIAEYSKGFVNGAGIYQVTIYVDDENDNPPKFNHEHYMGLITENSPLGTEVLVNHLIVVKDIDLGRNALFDVHLYGEGSHLFKVEQVNGTSLRHNKTLMASFDNFASAMNIEQSFANLQMMFVDAFARAQKNEPHFVISFTGPSVLDRERDNFYNLKMVARDKGGLSSEVKLGIFVADVNDNAPMFEKIAVFKNAGIEILEYTEDMEIYFVEPMQGVNYAKEDNRTDQLTFKITNAPYPSALRDSMKEMVDRYHIGTPRHLKTNHNYTRHEKYGRNYKSSRNTTKRQARRESTSSSPLFSLLENTPVGQRLIKVTANDEDFEGNARIFYEIVSENFALKRNNPRVGHTSDVRYFSIDRLSGEVKINRPLPAESEFRLNITAKDVGNLADYTVLRFRVLDVNDHAPVFMKSWYTYDIEEGVYSNTRVGKVEAIDEDFGQNANITYAIQSSEKIPFAVLPHSGVIIVTGDIDREVRDVYEFKIVAMDNGGKNMRLSSFAEVEINVLDLNDNSPEFTGYDEIFYSDTDTENTDRRLDEVSTVESNRQATSKLPVYKAYLNRNTEPGTFVKQVNAVDRDFTGNGNGLVMYSLHHNKLPYMFEIDSRDGIITTVSRFTTFHGYEHLNLTVVASDLGSPSRSSTALLLINLQGEEVLNEEDDDNYLFPHKYYEVEVVENNVAPMVILHVNTSSQYNREIFKWSIVPEMQVLRNDEFTIDPNNGTLWLTKSLDREMRDVYKIKVRADRVSREGRNVAAAMTYPVEGDKLKGLMYNEIRIVIRVIDENDNAPMFVGNGRPIVAVIPNTANFGFPVTRVQATDDDIGINAEIRYSLLNEPSKLFGIDAVTGRIRVLGPVSKGNQRVYGFDVKATDFAGGDSGKTTIANVFVYILDEHRQVRLVLAGNPVEVEKEVDSLTKSLSDATGLDVRVRLLEPHMGEAEQSTDVYLYAVDPKSNSVIDMADLQEAVSTIDMSTLMPSIPVLELVQLGSARGLSRTNTHIGALNGPELASIILAVVIFAGGLATAFCIVCVRYKRRRTLPPEASYSVGRGGSSTLMTGATKSTTTYTTNGKKKPPPLPPTGPKYYNAPSARDRQREYIDVPLPQSVLNANFNILDHDTSCLRFNQLHSGHPINLDNTGHSLHSSGRDSGLDLSRERSESPSRMQQAQAALLVTDQQVVRLRDKRHEHKNKCQCGHSELNVCSGEDSSDSYEDSLKNCQLPRRTSLPKAHAFRRSLNSLSNPIAGGAMARGVRHSFSGVRDDLIQGSPAPLQRNRHGSNIRNSMTDLEERLRNLERTFREPFLLNNNSHC
ncbi:cadherin-89D [Phlebotomus argentipes]|uniref:cadherin-89D n=1 Tax=Phlebotomus argentipes TaxID=94469 RepID=UPI002892E811|nr:cadherin-89D [Phlebotomus argentipes]